MLSAIPIDIVENGGLIDIKPVFNTLQVQRQNIEFESSLVSDDLSVQITKLDNQLLNLQSSETISSEVEKLQIQQEIARVNSQKITLNGVLQNIKSIFENLVKSLKSIIETLFNTFKKLLNAIGSLIDKLEKLIVSLASPPTTAVSQTLSNIKSFVISNLYNPLLTGFSQSKNYDTKQP